MNSLEQKLAAFRDAHALKGKGQLAVALVKIVNRYNEIVAEHETDPSLKIEM